MKTRSSSKQRMLRWWNVAFDRRYDALVVANGTPAPQDLLNYVRRRCDVIIALDGAVNTLLLRGIVPRFVVGDLDSATQPALLSARMKGTFVYQQLTQESGDMEKGFALCRKLGLKTVLVAAADGDATDHVVNALSVAASVRSLQVTFFTRSAVTRVLRGRTTLRLRVPKRHTLSWFGCPRATRCTLQGVQWPFTARELELGGFNSLSNLPVGREVVLRQGGGCSIFTLSLRPKPKTDLFLIDTYEMPRP